MNQHSTPAGERTITERLAQFVSGLRYEDLPGATADYAKRLLLDGIGCLMAGTRGGPAQRVSQALAGMHHLIDGPATNLVAGTRTSARDAAFANGVALYSVGVNDIHRPSISHPGGSIVPVVLAMGEWQQSSGSDMLAAMAAGYELMGRLGAAMQPSHWDRGFHPTGTFGTFGCAAAASRLFELDEQHTVWALGIAGSQASGNQSFHTDGSLTMIFHAGHAARNGIEAAAIAAQGFTGPHTVFEDPRGFLAAASDGARPERLVEGLGGNGSLAIADTSFRPYYGCTLTIAASGAAADILARRPRGARIETVEVRVHPDSVKVIDDPAPETLLAARLSIQFNVALVLQRWSVLIGDIDEADLRHPDIRRLMGVIRVVPDPSIGFWGSALKVGFADGATESCTVELPKGDPANPMTWDDVEAKFRELAGERCPRASTDRIVAAVRGMETVRGDQLVALILDGLAGTR